MGISTFLEIPSMTIRKDGDRILSASIAHGDDLTIDFGSSTASTIVFCLLIGTILVAVTAAFIVRHVRKQIHRKPSKGSTVSTGKYGISIDLRIQRF